MHLIENIRIDNPLHLLLLLSEADPAKVDPATVASDMSPRLGDVVTTIVIGWVFLVW